MSALKIDRSNYKIGMNQVEGLEAALRELSEPVIKSLEKRIYWTSTLDFESVEYESRDGFIANTHNCGGLSINEIIPKCEEYSFSFLSFGEYTYDDSLTEEENEENQDIEDSEGHNDASLRIWLKFEGYSDGKMHFYFYVGGGNSDAPYFRHKYESTVFETSFSCATLEDLKRVGARRIRKLLKAIEG